MQQFFNALQRFGIGRLAAIIGVSAGAAAALAVLVLNMGQAPQGLLFANLDLKEAGSITAALDQAGVKYEAKGDGSTIMVERDKVASTRLMLSSKGLPTSGSVGYEIFDNSSALGQTDFVQNLNRQRALEGELARTIHSLDGVGSARVHLVLPKRQLFEEEAEAPSASIVIGLTGRDLGADQVRAVRNLVASAVPNLKPDRVTVVDERGKLLAGGDSEMANQAAEGARNGAEDRIRRTVKDLVEGVVGPGKARVQVSADLDMARVTVQEEKYDPDGQVVRSTQTNTENSQESDSGASGQVSTSENIPGGEAGTALAGPVSTSGTTGETTNYEISRTTRTEVQEPGAIKRLSVAVAVDGVTTIAKDGKVSYEPRSTEEMKRIEQLVRSAVGFSTDRNDQISVVNVRFNREDVAGGTAAKSGILSSFDKNDAMQGGQMLILAIVAGLIIFFVARPLLKSAGPPSPLQLALAGGGAPVAAGMAPAYDQVPSNYALQGGGGGDNLALPPPSGADMDARIDIARIEGQVKASSVKRVSEFVDRHPDESVSILRSWLHDNS